MNASLSGEEVASTPYIRCPEVVWHLSELYLSFFHMQIEAKPLAECPHLNEPAFF